MSGVDDREAVFRELFGEPAAAYDDPELPGVQVRRFFGAVAKGHPKCDVWVTVGMSDRPMQNPDGDNVRRELIFYATPGGDYVAAMQFLARLPAAENAYIDQSHTIRGAGILFAGGDVDTELPHVVLLAPLLRQHAALGESLEIDGDSVELLWPVPISAAEHEMIQEEDGFDAFMDVLADNEHPWIFAPGRQSYVE
jgi:hypothetical protein